MTRRRLPHELALPRRTLLRGAVGGVVVTLALPALEAMLNEHGTTHADGSPLPRRLVTWMWGNGCRLEHWTPATQGPNYAPTEELAPLINVKGDCAILSNFKNYVAGRRGHHDGMAAFWTGYPFIQLDPQGAPYASKIAAKSLDQIAADIIGQNTYFKSLQVGVTKRHCTNQGPTLSTMSHRGVDQPLQAERDPQALFDKLFNSFMPTDDPEGAVRVAALDAVQGDVQRLKKRLSRADQARLDAHLEGLSQLQRQLLTIPPNCEVPAPPVVEPFNPDGTEPLVELNEAMVSLVTMALSCDLTRVVSFMYTGASGSQQFATLTPDKFPEFPGAADLSHADHHQTSHMNLAYEQLYIHRSTIISMEALAHLLETMKAFAEGTGNLLDQSCVYASSDVCEGWAHSEVDFPIVLAGGAGGRLKSNIGHYRSPNMESVSNLGLAVLKAVIDYPDDITKFGGSDGTYDGTSTTPCSAVLV